MDWLHRLFSRSKPHIPDALWKDCVDQLPFLRRLHPKKLERLKEIAESLLDKKTFTGAGGFELTDETAVLIAAQASLPVLNLTLDLYSDMVGVIVYPTAFVVKHTEMDEAGVMHEWQEPLSGEAIDSGGAVVLSWEAAVESNVPGHNVVIHEFAHKIDMGNGSANGCPPFLAAYHQDIETTTWQHVFSAAFAHFVQWVDDIDAASPSHAHYDALHGELPLDPYAAQHPAEFFAVASEAFFVLPAPLARIYPDIYQLLSKYYRQDPLADG